MDVARRRPKLPAVGKKPSDQASIIWAAAALIKLGCPGLRPCQGDAELEQKLQSATYRRTPDMVAGPIVGGGSRADFLIDVAELQGETLYNPRRPGGVVPPALLSDPQNNHGTLSGRDMPTEHFDGYLSTLNKKLRKYSGERQNSPMVGLCVHLDSSAMQSNASVKRQDLMKLMTRIDYVRFLEAAFGDQAGAALRDCFGRLFGPDLGPAVLFFQIPQPFTFLLHTVKLAEASDLRVLMLVNDAVLAGEFRDHPVIEWLRRLGEHAESAPRK